MINFERASSDRRIGWLSLLGLLLVPLLVAGGFLWATWGSSTRLDHVQAAIVNLDEPVTINKQTVPLGRQLAGGLVTGGDEPSDKNFTWVLTDQADANQGLADGSYAAVVTIPKNFSKQATSYSKDKPSEIAPAQINVATSGVGGITDTAIAQAISSTATATLNTELTKQYLDQIYVGFNSTGEQFKTVANAADDLSDGTKKLSDGIGKSADGAGEFADGLDQLDTGGQQLATGASQLSKGTGDLADGLGKLSEGTSKVATGGRDLANGSAKLADGASKNADGAALLATGARGFDTGLQESAAGADQAAAGGGKLTDGAVRYRDGLVDSAAEIGTGLAQLPTKVSEAVLIADPARTCAQPQPADPRCFTYLQGVQAGLGQSALGMNDLKPTAAFRKAYAKNPKTATPEYELKTAMPLKATAAEDPEQACPTIAGLRVDKKRPPLSDQPGLLRGFLDLCTGLQRAASGAQQLSGKFTTYSNGVTKAATGAKQLSTGVSSVADGADQLADGLKPLAAGVKSSADGATQLATGASQLSTGVTGLSGGITASADGADQLADGLTQLDDGGTKLANGTKKLADGLAEGADQVPTYDKTLRTRLSQTVATPVTSERPDSLFSNTALTSLLAVVALWLGGLASFLVLRAIPARTLTSMKPAWRLTAEALLPAAVISAVQGVVLAAILHALFDLGAGATAGLAGLLVLAGLTSAALNQALVAWLGGIGRFISVGVVVLTAAAATTSALPTALQGLVPFLPLTPALEGAKALVTGADGAGGFAGTLLAWLLVGTVLSLIAVARHKQLPAVALQPAPA